MDNDQNNRIRELTELIATERDQETFAKLVAELNQILDEHNAGQPRSNR